MLNTKERIIFYLMFAKSKLNLSSNIHRKAREKIEKLIKEIEKAGVWVQMNKNIKKTVYEILKTNEYARENDNYLIVCVAQRLEPSLIESYFRDLSKSKLNLEGITRARRAFFEEYPEMKPKRITAIREQERQNYELEYSHIPIID